MVATGGSTVSQKEQCHTKCIFLFGSLEIFKACLYFRFFDFAKQRRQPSISQNKPKRHSENIAAFCNWPFCHLEKGRILYGLVKKHIIVS